MTRTNKREIAGAKRGENEAVLVLGLEPSKKGELFCHGEVFFLLTRPLMGDPFVFKAGRKPSIIKKTILSTFMI